MTCLGGTDRKLPGPSRVGFSPFTWVSAVPLTIMMFSVAGCQCHGTAHPALPFIFRMDASLLGSPCSVAITKQSGVPGMWAIEVESVRILSFPCACDDITRKATNNTSMCIQNE